MVRNVRLIEHFKNIADPPLQTNIPNLFGIQIIFPQIQSGQSTYASGIAGKFVFVKCQDRQTCRINSTQYS
jgi:hypothetical protein